MAGEWAYRGPTEDENEGAKHSELQRNGIPKEPYANSQAIPSLHAVFQAKQG